MGTIAVELIIIILLICANGVFAMTEIAIVTSRRGKLQQLAAAGDRRAQAALELAESPNRFLSTVQVGITLVGILVGAFGGATIASEISKALPDWPVVGAYRDAAGLAVVVFGLTYLSLVLGELVPKRIGMGHPERVALLMARPMLQLSEMAGPAVKLLGWSTDALLRLAGLKAQQAVVSEDEVKGLMQEGLRAGAFHKVESDIVESVLDLDRLPVREIMTPRPKVIWLGVNDTHEQIWHKIVVSGHSYFPVYEGNRDNVAGVVSVKAIYANLAAGIAVKLRDLIVAPQIVPASQNVLKLVETFKASGKHLAMVADEFGNIVGLVTLNDIMEAIVGDLPSQMERAKPSITERQDGTWLIDGLVEVEKLEQKLAGFKLQTFEDRDYTTVAGYVVKHLGRLPTEGDQVTVGGYTFEVLDMDRHRVDKILVSPPRAEASGGLPKG